MVAFLPPVPGHVDLSSSLTPAMWGSYGITMASGNLVPNPHMRIAQNEYPPEIDGQSANPLLPHF